MFQLTLFKDDVKIHPNDFALDQTICIERELNLKYANKVVTEIGLCIQLFDIVSIGEFQLLPGEGCAHCQVKFRLVVFRPFVGEILCGKVKSSNKFGLQISLGFFDDIYIAADSLQQPSTFHPEEQLWFWNYDSHELYIDEGEDIRFRIVSEAFYETPAIIDPLKAKPIDASSSSLVTSTISPFDAATAISSATAAPLQQDESFLFSDSASPTSTLRKTPYILRATIDDDGLGLLSWWSA